MQPDNTGGGYCQQTDEEPRQPVASPPTPPVEPSAAPVDAEQSISWQASEYIHHDKDNTWYLWLGGATIILLLIAIFLVQSLTFAILIVVMAITLGVYANRPPRIMEYSLHQSGLEVNDKTFSFHDFRAFAILQEGAVFSAFLIPVKRFMPAVTLYFPPEHGEDIVDLLGTHLPHENAKLDVVDKLIRKIRF